MDIGHMNKRLIRTQWRFIGTRRSPSSFKTPQIGFYIFIPDPIDYLRLSPVQYGLFHDRPKPVLGLGALLGIHQMPVLGRYSFRAVLDLENSAMGGSRVKNHHVEFPHRELKDEHLLILPAPGAKIAFCGIPPWQASC